MLAPNPQQLRVSPTLRQQVGDLLSDNLAGRVNVGPSITNQIAQRFLPALPPSPPSRTPLADSMLGLRFQISEAMRLAAENTTSVVPSPDYTPPAVPSRSLNETQLGQRNQVLGRVNSIFSNADQLLADAQAAKEALDNALANSRDFRKQIVGPWQTVGETASIAIRKAEERINSASRLAISKQDITSRVSDQVFDITAKVQEVESLFQTLRDYVPGDPSAMMPDDLFIAQGRRKDVAAAIKYINNQIDRMTNEISRIPQQELTQRRYLVDALNKLKQVKAKAQDNYATLPELSNLNVVGGQLRDQGNEVIASIDALNSLSIEKIDFIKPEVQRAIESTKTNIQSIAEKGFGLVETPKLIADIDNQIAVLERTLQSLPRGDAQGTAQNLANYRANLLALKARINQFPRNRDELLARKEGPYALTTEQKRRYNKLPQTRSFQNLRVQEINEQQSRFFSLHTQAMSEIVGNEELQALSAQFNPGLKGISPVQEIINGSNQTVSTSLNKIYSEINQSISMLRVVGDPEFGARYVAHNISQVFIDDVDRLTDGALSRVLKSPEGLENAALIRRQVVADLKKKLDSLVKDASGKTRSMGLLDRVEDLINYDVRTRNISEISNQIDDALERAVNSQRTRMQGLERYEESIKSAYAALTDVNPLLATQNYAPTLAEITRKKGEYLAASNGVIAGLRQQKRIIEAELSRPVMVQNQPKTPEQILEEIKALRTEVRSFSARSQDRNVILNLYQKGVLTSKTEDALEAMIARSTQPQRLGSNQQALYEQLTEDELIAVRKAQENGTLSLLVQSQKLRRQHAALDVARQKVWSEVNEVVNEKIRKKG